MRKIWIIIKREYITRVKTKAFLITTLIVPLSGIATIALIAFIAKHGPNQSLRLAIVDNAGGLATSLARNLKGTLSNGKPQFAVIDTIDRPASIETTERDLRSRVNSDALDAYLVIPADSAQSFEFHTKNSGDFAILAPLTAAVNRALVEARLSARGIHVDDVSDITRGADLQVIKISASGESVERGQTFAISIGLVILLYMSLLMYGIITMRSVLEEKTTRTMEVLISSVRPSQLLVGKILGVAAAAFTQFLIWVISLGLLVSYGAVVAALFSPGSSFRAIHFPIVMVVWATLFFFGGYFLYSAMFAAIGAACSSETEAGQLQWLAMGPLVFAISIYWVVLTDPTSTASLVLSEIPFLSPILMPLRLSLQAAPIWQTSLSIVLLLLTIVGVIYASAKIYRIGVLMYGKRPTVPELLRWLRYS
jgi:ABC-2 type transport system permease protein